VRRFGIIGGFVVFLLLLVFLSLRGTASQKAGDPADPVQVALGKEVYAANCASCHGANLEGQPNWQQELPTGGLPAPPHDPSGHTWHHDDQSLFTTVKFGGAATAPTGFTSNMPPFGEQLSDREIWAVLAFIKSTWPPEVQEAQRRGHQ
jgi:mono/diheme cytochrome c family protein